MWNYRGQERPDFAVEPETGQESVWDYPRPPELRDCGQHVQVRTANKVIAETRGAKRVCETASPPTFYIPPEDVNLAELITVNGSSYCEWKGSALYWALANDPRQPVGWSYPDPTTAFAALRDWLCFYPGRIECSVDDERVRPQDGGFYGGWVTNNIVGPWKGSANSGHW